MRIERTTGTVFQSLIEHPDVRPHFAGSGSTHCPDRDDFYYLIAHDERTMGGFLLMPFNAALYRMHVAFLPGRRAGAVDAWGAARAWLKAHTPIQAVMGSVAEPNRAARLYARRIGFQLAGRVRHGTSVGDLLIFEDAQWDS